MCLIMHPEDDDCRKPVTGAARPPHPDAAMLPLPATSKAEPSEPPLQFIIELQQSPACIRIKDLQSGEQVAELDEVATQELLALDGGSAGPGTEALMQAVLSAAWPTPQMEPIPRGLTSRALQEQIAENDETGTRKTRRKLWELPQKLHCPVIGTCLEADELRRIARKAGAQTNGELTDYDLHVSFVSASDDKNPLSLVAHKTLERKYAGQVKRFSRAKDSGQLTELWEEASARGEVPAALWATLTHPQCDNALKARTFEQVHMLSHQIGAGLRADLKRLTDAESELCRLQRDLDAMHRRHRRQLEDREEHSLELETRLRDAKQQGRELAAIESQLRHELSELRVRENQRYVAELVSDLAQRERLLADARQQNTALDRALASAEQAASDLKSNNAELSAECKAMERFITRSLSACDSCEQTGCDGNPDLGGRRILCVGGRNRRIEQYREVVARCNGRFEHYDGGIEDNRQRLDTLLSSADAIVCATDAVSHDAYYRLKRFCKRHEKPHVFLRSSGISSFTRALFSVTA